MSKLKKNATSFKKGRSKTGGRKAGTPNKTTASLREAVRAAACAAGNELGGDGEVGYLTRVAINDPKSFLSLFARLMPHPEPEPPPPPRERILHTLDDVREELRKHGVDPVSFGRALCEEDDDGEPLPDDDSAEPEHHSAEAGSTTSADGGNAYGPTQRG